MILKEHNQPGDIHKKHADLTRPTMGNFNRNEWAIIGAPCNVIKSLADSLIDALSTKYKCAYADTAHNDDITSLPGRLASKALIEYTEKINYRQINYNASFNQYKLREVFADADLVLVNGNHQQANAQVVIISIIKKESLKKRINQLNNVKLILLADDAVEVFDFIKEAVPNWRKLPLYKLNETKKIIGFFETQMEHAKPVLNGLVLAGGKSERMGFDKGSVNWHGKEQRHHIADMLKPFCEEVFVSCRSEQQRGIGDQYSGLTDTFIGLGPFGGILSAFREKPDCAWFVVACDLPLIQPETLKYLTESRNTSSVATAYQSTFNNFPEPLITIWEPKSYPVLLSFLAQGYSCPRKVLINSDVTLLNALNTDDLTNVNTPDELEKVKQALHQQ